MVLLCSEMTVTSVEGMHSIAAEKHMLKEKE